MRRTNTVVLLRFSPLVSLVFLLGKHDMSIHQGKYIRLNETLPMLSAILI